MAKIVPDDVAGRAEAVAVLRAGGLVATPTDTVYGLAVALGTPDGIQRLFHVKQRPPDKAIMLLLADPSQAADLGEMSPAAATLGAALWPGGLTLVVPQRHDVRLPEILTAGQATIGLRVPDHPAPRALAAGVGPIPVTSANRSGDPTLDDAQAIDAAMGGSLDLILDGGPAPGGTPSTVIDCSGASAVILRAGAVPTARIRHILDAAGVAHDIAAD